jgi:membrane protein
VGAGGVGARARLGVERARARYGYVDVTVRTFKRFSEDDGGVLAAALTYYFFFSIFPLLIFTASAIGFLTFLSEAFRERVLAAGLEGVPLLSQILSVENLTLMQQRRGTLVVVGLILALYSGTGCIVALEHALNRINRVEHEPGFVPKRVASLRWLGVFGLAAIVSIALGASVQFAARALGGSVFVAVAVSVAMAAVSTSVNLVLFATAFRFLTVKEWSWRDVLPGALLAAVAFEVLKLVGAQYLATGSQGREATFGAFAAAAGLLVASYLLAQIILLAAELNAVFAERRETRQSSLAI